MTINAASDEFTKLVSVISSLRSDNGCPWDQKQTPDTLVKYLVEESGELAEAIRQGNVDQVREESGDLFFILILLIRIYEEKKSFTMADVLAAISDKMVRRHPHVFSDAETGSEDELRQQWEEIKAQEKNMKSAG